MGRVLLGLALLLPALVALVWSYVVPTVSTMLTSFQHDSLVGEPEPAGGENYQQLFEDGLIGQFGFALLLGLLPLAFALLAAPLLAVVADRAGRVPRLVTRGVLALPIAGYAPTALFLGWRVRLAESDSLADVARLELTGILAMTSFGLVVAVAATAFLSALRQREPGRRPTPALLTVGGFVGLAVLALTLQIFTAPTLLTGGGPDGSTVTPMLDVVQDSFRIARMGLGAAGSTVLLLLLGLLGLAATGLLLASRTLIEFDGWRDRSGGLPGNPTTTATPAPPAALAAPDGPAAPTRGPGRTVYLGTVIAALVVFLGIFGWASAPWLQHAFGGAELPGDISTSDVLVNTWLPPFISALVSVGLAAVAGFGIGALRPLGRWSELLLIPFAPWLFVGVGPLAVAGFKRVAEGDQVNTFLGLIPPVWLSVPALFVFTLLFRGQHPKWRSGGDVGRTLLLPALPMLAAVFLLTWLFSAQQPFWSRLIASDVDRMPAPVLAEMLMAGYDGPKADSLSLVLPLPLLIVFLLAFAALQVGYLDRLAIRVGRSASEPPAPPAPQNTGFGAPVPPQPYGPPTQAYGPPAYGTPPHQYGAQQPYGAPTYAAQPYGAQQPHGAQPYSAQPPQGSVGAGAVPPQPGPHGAPPAPPAPAQPPPAEPPPSVDKAE
ncbi:sugar ABC transporter permease [Plantactinospora soyae]|uniref:ABC-type sugar transport system permease subunit n=1 Tax=Plantactinospora soyae TaxID=1544732 RepID=A0A927M343_9ACTN|nr:sugar ABC transporter permease [Plantactinospora soyae]MBE1485906.1 ABC-type sugar transport system permease subunit [Plantactinospora soyae]